MPSDLALILNDEAGIDVRALLNTLITRFQDVVNVKDWGALGDGLTDDTAAIQAATNFAYGTSGSPHADAGRYSNRTVFFPNGNYIITAPITVRSVRGGRIMGGGRLSTKITQATPNTSVFVTNGFDY
jgi:hypothetical protein